MVESAFLYCCAECERLLQEAVKAVNAQAQAANLFGEAIAKHPAGMEDLTSLRFTREETQVKAHAAIEAYQRHGQDHVKSVA